MGTKDKNNELCMATNNVAPAPSQTSDRAKQLLDLLEAINKDRSAVARISSQILAAYERREAEVVRSLEHTRKIVSHLRDQPSTALDERSLCQLILLDRPSGDW